MTSLSFGSSHRYNYRRAIAMSAQQVVFRLKHRNGFDGLYQREENIPEITKHEVLVKVRSVSLNFRDIVIATSKYHFPVAENVVPCSDMAGDIVQTGESVKGLHAGDKVIACFDITNLYGPQIGWNGGQGGPIDGVLRQYVALPASAVIKVPSDTPHTYAEWASLVCTGTTVWNAFYGNLPLRPGQVVLCQGTGGVSITAAILAKAAGAKVIITSSSDDKLALAKSKFGADHGINYKSCPDWAAEALKLTGGRGVDYIIENGGSGTISQSIKAVTYGGVINVIGFLSQASQEDMPDVAGLALSKGAVVRGITVGSKQLLEEAVRFVGQRQLRLPVEKEFPFSLGGVRTAYEYLVSGQHIGKVCITVD
ncbi:Zinc-type alcohol dehydrogenase-like protein [Purpureocillium lavendulum]|uniref:Zinc-type alcohol dehydrogenase-like protein n=1 Tax=Purpureocillium lavendulum TaxID=1247861 RepID=A0AB34FHN0_9HYPO|nr:Zinc-type alcohol dehydrogenase-like protein [Purpureocillium lavendulum]